MGADPFAVEDEIFNDESVLNGDRGGPDTFYEVAERDEQIDQFVDALMSMKKGQMINDVLVYGHPGVGKTLVTRLLGEYLETEGNRDDGTFATDSVRVIYQNCSEMDTSYKVARNLVNQFRDPDDEVPESGHSASYLYSELFDELESAPQSHVLFILDEIDTIGQDDQLIYKLTRVHDEPQDVDSKQTETGFIGIVNDLTWRKQLKSTVQDTLTSTEVHFPAYNADQLQTILRERAQDAFRDGALDDGVVPLAAAIGSRSSGSARVALDILKTAGKVARQNDYQTVTEAHVREAEDIISTSRIVQDLREMPTQSKAVMHGVLLAENCEQTPVPQTELYTVYRTVVEHQWGGQIQSKRSMDRRVQDLLSLGLISVETVHNKSGGTRDEISVGDIDAAECREGLKQDLLENYGVDETDISFVYAAPTQANSEQAQLGN
jgi:cell division control protein 6